MSKERSAEDQAILDRAKKCDGVSVVCQYYARHDYFGWIVSPLRNAENADPLIFVHLAGQIVHQVAKRGGASLDEIIGAVKSMAELCDKEDELGK